MKFKKYGIIAAIIGTILVSFSESKKKKKQAKQEDPLNRRPNSVKPELYCDSCIAIVTEATKKLYNKKSEADVFDAIEHICDPELYYSYRNKNNKLFKNINLLKIFFF